MPSGSSRIIVRYIIITVTSVLLWASLTRAAAFGPGVVGATRRRGRVPSVVPPSDKKASTTGVSRRDHQTPAPVVVVSTSQRLQATSDKDDDNNNNNINNSDGELVVLASLSSLSLVTSAVTLWSEVAIYQTGCGPLYLPDLVERISYQAVIVVSGVAWFIRIVTRQGLADFGVDQGMMLPSQRSARWLLRAAEAAAYLAVVLAIVVLWNQMQNNVDMDGLSGIDIAACKARRDFLLQP